MTEIHIRRFVLFGVITAVLILLVVWRYFSIMVITSAEKARPTRAEPHIERGPILDRKGRILAIQTRLDSVTAWIPEVKDPAAEAELLGELLGVGTQELLSEFHRRDGFMYVKRKITPSDSRRIKEAIDAGRLPGISLSPEYGRNYPEKSLASHVIGFAGTDNKGLDGIELTFNETLFPDPGEDDDLVYGNQLFLTIDVNTQYMVERLIERAYEEHQAETVMMIVMNARSGEILAYGASPDYDVNAFNLATPDMKKNRPITYLYEPGSVLKVFTIASMLQLKGIDPETHFYCDGIYTGHGEEEPIRCLGIHGDITTGGILKYSCNDGAATASESVEQQAFYRMLRSFGFGRPTGIPLPGEAAGILRSPEEWSARTKPTIAIGQEISVTALQIASAATVFANHGILLQPTIIRKIVSPDGRIVENYARKPLEQVISPENAREILLMMETATQPDGTAHRAAVDGLRISAKTGTAEIYEADSGAYSKTDFVASCLAIFPTDDPSLIVYASIARPSAGEYLGGRIAAPLVRTAIEDLVDYYGIAREGDTVLHHSGTIHLQATRKAQIGDTMPDFEGYSKRELLPLLAREDIDVRLQGEGWVVKQDPPPGSAITTGMVIRLELR